MTAAARWLAEVEADAWADIEAAKIVSTSSATNRALQADAERAQRDLRMVAALRIADKAREYLHTLNTQEAERIDAALYLALAALDASHATTGDWHGRDARRDIGCDRRIVHRRWIAICDSEPWRRRVHKVCPGTRGGRHALPR